jgi:hypothetical protein
LSKEGGLKDSNKAGSMIASWEGDHIAERLQAAGEEENKAWSQAI